MKEREVSTGLKRQSTTKVGRGETIEELYYSMLILLHSHLGLVTKSCVGKCSTLNLHLFERTKCSPTTHLSRCIFHGQHPKDPAIKGIGFGNKGTGTEEHLRIPKSKLGKVISQEFFSKR